MEYGARSASSAGVPLSLAAGQHLKDLEFKLTPQGVITGKVLDEEGEPLAGVEVAAFRQRAFGSRRRIVETIGEITNDVGKFRIPELDPGSYLLAADRWGRCSLQ